MLNRRAYIGLAAGLTGALALGLNASAKRGPLKIGEVVKAPVLRDIASDKPLDLASYKGKKVVVGIFVQKNCGTTWKYYGKMGEIIAKFKAKGVEVVGIHSSQGETDDMMLSDLQSKNLNIPLLDDKKDQALMKLVGANCTPTFVVIDKDSKLRYFGSYDKYGSAPNYVPDALNAILAGKPVKMAQTRAFG
ncbi:redoxin family protein [Armatimonas rosea]|uniref:Peroxiredoxin n=1 Tax=Armatimonas rosea TaxID=685828 RepID=A0A7W9STP9_ARMRO|nr:redoxin family protein [Armatimonas rosea]MBB6051779.1 peroxiredoxin [Armatimonas rosea]